jgi:SAM-dependent methyltransferase
LKQRVRELAAAGVASDYVAEMWQLVLDWHEKELEGKKPRITEDCDALPYVPADFAAHHLALSSESRVLDIGCLGGYGLYDLAVRRKQGRREMPMIVGVDKDPASVEVARALADIWGDGETADFNVAEAQGLPLADACCDLVIARLLLPYVWVCGALDEIDRVLKPEGMVLFQLHAPRYYLRQAARQGWALGRRCYYLRPVISRWLCLLSGRQPRGKRWAEMAMTPTSLVRTCKPLGWEEVWRGGFASKPLIAFRRG